MTTEAEENLGSSSAQISEPDMPAVTTVASCDIRSDNHDKT